jgi:glycosyltransferase involved in cell wall biosynthesis
VKLLIYSHYFAPSIGGVETIVMSLARGLVELRTLDGAPEFAITFATQTPCGEFDDQSLPFAVVRQPGFWQLLQLVRHADVVHLAGPSFITMLLAWLLRKPYVVEHHTYQSICPNGLLIHQPERSVCPGHFQAGNYAECRKCQSVETSKIRSLINVLAAFLRRALVRRASRNIAVSKHVERRLAVPRTSVIQHGIDKGPEIIAQTSNGFSMHKRVRFTFVGRFVQEKGLSVLVDALALLAQQGREFEAKLIGDGPERTKIEAQITAAKLNSRVKIMGYLSGTAFAEAAADVSMIVMPSVWEETAGLAAIEQMMRGRLVICSDIGGLSEIVGDAGMKFPTGDAAALAACLNNVICDPSLAEGLGAKARVRAMEFFSRAQMIESHAAIYRNAQTD